MAADSLEGERWPAYKLVVCQGLQECRFWWAEETAVQVDHGFACGGVMDGEVSPWVLYREW